MLLGFNSLIMFNNQNLYPTPDKVAAIMIKGCNFYNKYILEPSAGTGALAKHLYGAEAVHLIENDPDAVALLEGKMAQKGSATRTWRYVASDFLKFTASIQYDYIIMNPPFDNGAQHLLHAWQIADGSEIRCLLNAETIENPYTEERERLLEIIRLNGGQIEHLGRCFAGADAERRTNVEVVLVTLKKPLSKKLDINFDSIWGEQTAQGLDEEKPMFELATGAYIQNSVKSFDAAVEAFKDVLLAVRRFKHHANGCSLFHGQSIDKDILDLISFAEKDAFNKGVGKMNAIAWNRVIFEQNDYQKLITNGVREKFKTEQQRRGAMAFNLENISNFLDILVGTRGQVMELCIEQVFDFLTAFDKRNVIHKEGWKTNSHYKVNKKVIVPALCSYDTKWQSTSRVGYGRFDEKFNDVDKALCYIAGMRFEDCRTVVQAVADKVYDREISIYDQILDTTFFTIKCYKKGTMHLNFKDESIWARFNQAAAKGKNWLG